MSLQAVTDEFLGPQARVGFSDWRGNRWGPADAPVHVRFNSVDALNYFVRSRGELGFGRAYVSGAMDIEGDIWTLLEMGRNLGGLRFSPAQIRRLAAEIGVWNLRHAPPIPPEEIDVGRRIQAHSKRRDRQAISHHYNVSNDFYRLVLGPSLTYSCAVFQDPAETLEQAQANKYELICRKLGLEPGMRLLDVGCGWGGMAMHAAIHHGVDVVGVTISDQQAELARKRVAEAGLTDHVDIRLQDYRDIPDDRFDAISSIGMFEHVGLARLRQYLEILCGLLAPSGRLLNHQIGRTPGRPSRLTGREPTAVARNGFIHRYVFPDGELHEVGDVIGAMQRTGFEVRHMESLREHYGITLRRWVENLERQWTDAVAEVGEGRARVWRLYMAATSVNFTVGTSQIHQVLGVKTPSSGERMGWSGLPLRTDWDHELGPVAPSTRSTG